jgi:hypothetical protein
MQMEINLTEIQYSAYFRPDGVSDSSQPEEIYSNTILFSYFILNKPNLANYARRGKHQMSSYMLEKAPLRCITIQACAAKHFRPLLSTYL